jgi:hypothetical protein
MIIKEVDDMDIFLGKVRSADVTLPYPTER